jgi:hypothetical protein
MSWFRTIIFLLPLALFGCASPSDSPNTDIDAGEAPPVSLVQENCRKAEIIVEGLVLAQHAGDSASYSTATLRIEKVYKGTVHVADTLVYSFYKEADEPMLQGKKLIFFLKAYHLSGRALWVRASDLPTFSANAATEKLLHQTLNQ